MESDTYSLSRENAALKDQLKRALKELQGYQTKFPSAYISVSEEEDDLELPWSISPESMGPLIVTYDASEYMI
jgi:hypothetical protein